MLKRTQTVINRRNNFFIHIIDLYFATHKILQKKAKSATKHLTSQP